MGKVRYFDYVIRWAGKLHDGGTKDMYTLREVKESRVEKTVEHNIVEDRIER